MTAGGNLRFLSREDSFEMTEYRWHDSGRSEQGHSLFPGIVRIQCPYRRVYAAAHVEIADNRDPLGMYLFNKVFQDFIYLQRAKRSCNDISWENRLKQSHILLYCKT